MCCQAITNFFKKIGAFICASRTKKVFVSQKFFIKKVLWKLLMLSIYVSQEKKGKCKNYFFSFLR